MHSGRITPFAGAAGEGGTVQGSFGSGLDTTRDGEAAEDWEGAEGEGESSEGGAASSASCADTGSVPECVHQCAG